MSDAQPIKTPMGTSKILSKDENGKKAYQTIDKGMIESLLYLTFKNPDIMHNICLCARF